jgi:hypothetical protein
MAKMDEVIEEELSKHQGAWNGEYCCIAGALMAKESSKGHIVGKIAISSSFSSLVLSEMF